MKKTLIALALASSFSATAEEQQHRDDDHNLETVVVTASPLRLTVLESAQPVTVLSGEALQQQQAATLGETLKNQVGVHSTYYGPVASSPIIRGLEGPRVKVVQNGLDASDASRVGPDHVVTTEASTATQIEILRGPATLLYGSGAIGGVVNIVDNRLPNTRMDGVEGSVGYQHDTVSSENLFNVNLDGGSGNFAWHIDAFDRDSDNYEIPDGIIIDGEETDGELENTFIDATGYTFGGAWVGDKTTVALSYGRLENDYGIPGHHHHHEDEHDEEHEGEEHEGEEHDHDEEEEVVFGSLEQDRFQAMIDWKNLDGWVTDIHWHSAYTDYQHSEIEDGEIGTTFENDTIETRLWAEMREMNGWNGVIGVHYSATEFEAIGEEAFTPPSDDTNFAVFLLEEKQFGEFRWQLGARVERVELDPDNDFFEHDEDHHDEHEEEHEGEEHDEHDEHEEIMFDTLSYTPISASAGVVWSYADSSTLAFNVAYSERAPSASEVFSNGAHIGTNSYEVGAGFDIITAGDEYEIVQSATDPKEEKSKNIDLTWRTTSDDFTASVSVFYNWVDDYLYLRDTGLVFEDDHDHGHEDDHDDDHHDDDHDDHGDEHGDEHEGEEGLPIFHFNQEDATLYGFEAEMDWHFSDQWRLEGIWDYTRAKLDNSGNVPRIPPMRIAADLHWESDSWHAEAGFSHYFEQDKVANMETSTDSYTLVNASVRYYMDLQNTDVTIYLKGNNLTDEEARVHSSFLKEDAPLPGRSFVLGAKFDF